ncbi:MAG: M56 family metallopeptidase [Chryseosolibacter sp.]
MMNKIADFLSDDWSSALGWTFFHSIWQALLILFVVIICLKLVTTAFARIRYAIACGAFGVFVSVVFLTFIHSLHEPRVVTSSVTPTALHSTAAGIELQADTQSLRSSLSGLSATVEEHMPPILTAWFVGFLIFTIRFSFTIWYTLRLRSSANTLDGTWSAYVTEMSKSLGINRLVTLAASVEVTTPVVVGYLKPVIILPMGMLSGLTTEQIETVLIHELAHIKRHDYLINVIQSVVETVFFFNPFIWILSNIIRREREYCCDDLVISRHGGIKAYAHALAQLAAARLSTHGFALTLGGRKYELLNRIRRIMEKSVKNNSGKGRMVIPVLLVVTALMCISWLGIKSEENAGRGQFPSEQDTVRRKENGARYTRKSIITLDENGKPHEEIIEKFEGDEALRPLMQHGAPDVSVFPMFPDVTVNPPLPDLGIQAMPDSIPPPGRSFFNQDEWEEFSHAFDERFRKSFEKFHAFRDNDLSEFMQEFEENFKSEDWSTGLDLHIPQDFLQEFRPFDDSTVFENLEHELEQLRELNLEPLHELENNLRLREGKFRKFEEAIREELIKDRYLSEGESIESLEWNDESFEVNGKPVRKSDLKKYQELHEAYMGETRGMRKVE